MAGALPEMHPTRVEHRAKKAEALALKRAGMGNVAIAAELGCDRVTVWRLIREALEETGKEIAENAEALRSLEYERIERYISSLEAKAMAGDYQAHRALLRWHERLAKLLNLDLAEPEQQGANITVIAVPPWMRDEPQGEVIEGREVESGDEDQ